MGVENKQIVTCERCGTRTEHPLEGEIDEHYFRVHIEAAFVDRPGPPETPALVCGACRDEVQKVLGPQNTEAERARYPGRALDMQTGPENDGGQKQAPMRTSYTDSRGQNA